MKAYNADQADARVALWDAITIPSGIINIILSIAPAARIVTQVGECMTWAKLWNIFRAMGYELEPMRTMQWLTAVHQDTKLEREAHPLWSLAYLVNSQANSEEGKGQKKRLTDLALKVAAKRNIDFLRRLGFIP